MARVWLEKFGLRIFEGYGCTEMAPVVAANVPDVTDGRVRQRGSRAGTVGHPLPGVAAKVVDPDTMEGPIFDREGLLIVKAASRMAGYLEDPERTVEVVRDGWYVTGDIARIDPAGVIEITGRLSRFSKIGGEMVPHIKIEETLQRVLGGEDELKAVVSAVPDAKKGERLVVLHLPLGKPPEQICRELAAAGLPNLLIPSPDSFSEISEIPVLGTGKLDLKRLKELAMEKFGAEVAAG